jgi:hypothetical protein
VRQKILGVDSCSRSYLQKGILSRTIGEVLKKASRNAFDFVDMIWIFSFEASVVLGRNFLVIAFLKILLLV